MSEITQQVPALTTTGLTKFEANPTDASLARKNELLELASLVLSVTNEEEEMDAIYAASQIKAVEQGIEKSRKEIKAPILAAGNVIDEAAKKFVKELSVERIRIEGLLAKRAKELREERERVAEAQRLEAERIAAAAYAAQLREHEEELSLAAAVGDAAPPPIPAAPMVVYAPPPPPVEKMDGASYKEEFDFEVTDIHEVYAWSRLFVRLEVDRAQLKAFLNIPGNGEKGIPGVRVFKKEKAIVRAARSTAPVVRN